jgi:serine phosphatase RsbU (regulator of sigma subunit)
VLDTAVGDLLAQAPFAVAVLRGPELRVDAVNEAARALLGGRVVIGESLGQALPELTARGDLEPFRHVLATGEPHREAVRQVVLTHGGRREQRHLTVDLHPLRDGDGVVAGVLCTAVDITEQVTARQRSEWLATISRMLLEASLEHSDVLEQAASLVTPQLGELCVINQVEPDGSLRRAAVAHTDASAADAVAAIRQMPPSADAPAYRVLRTGRPEILGALDGLRLQELARDDDVGSRLVRELGLASTLIVPLRARGRTLGTLSVSSTEPDRYTDAEVELAQAAAARASLALDTAELYGSQRAATETAERARARTSGLQRVTGALSSALTIAGVAEIIVAEGAQLLHADSATVLVSVDGGLEIVRSTGWSPELIEQYRHVAVEPGTPVGDAVKQGHPIWLESRTEWQARYPRSAPIHSSGGYQAGATIPLVIAERTLGVLMLSFTQPRALAEDDRTYLLALADQCAQALDRAQLYAAEREARSAAELQRDRVTFLAEASLGLDAPMSSTDRLQRLADLAVPRIADWCAVHLRRGTSVDAVAVAHSDPAKLAFVAELMRRYPQDTDSPRGALEVIRTGIAELTPEIPEELLVAVAQDETHLELIRALGMTSAMVVPLTVRGRTFGAITLIAAESKQRFGETDLAFAQDLANRAALAVDNGRLYEEQRTLATTLQQALLPAELPSIAGVEVAARYLAAGETNEVGGDLYDVFALGSDEPDDGAGDEAGPERWSLLIGDVCGKGAVAAALTALIRHTVRAEASHHPDPHMVLTKLNRAILRQLGPAEARFCTVLYGVLSVAWPEVRITTACAGHMPPRVIRAGGVVELPGGGTVLGVFDDPALEIADVRLAPGEALVLYTDGITEARGEPGFYGFERLDAVLGRCIGMSADAVADEIAHDVLEFQNDSPADDIAVLVVRASPQLPRVEV